MTKVGAFDGNDMSQGNKAVVSNNKRVLPYPLTEREIKLIELFRKKRIDYGIMQCLVYYQEGEIVRVETEPARESHKM